MDDKAMDLINELIAIIEDECELYAEAFREGKLPTSKEADEHMAYLEWYDSMHKYHKSRGDMESGEPRRRRQRN